MTQDERTVTRLMSQYAREAIAKDARLLDVHLEGSTWVASAVSKKGAQQVTATQSGGRWTIQHQGAKAGPGARELRQHAHVGSANPLGVAVQLGIVLAVIAAGWFGFQMVRGQLAAPKGGVPVEAAQTDPGGSGLLGSANALANDPKRMAAAEQLIHKTLGNGAVTQNLSQLQQLEQTKP